MRKVAVFTGTRAEYGLLSGLIKAIQKNPQFELQLLVSGMHLSPEFGETWHIIEEEGVSIDAKVEMLLSSDTAVGVVKSVGLGIIGYADTLQRLNPDILVILGDRFEALAIAQTAMLMRIPIVHLHGGEITEGAYDDAIRHAITKMSTIHCTATEAYRRRVIQLGEEPSRVFNVGAIGLDYLQYLSFLSISELSASLTFDINNPFFLVTYHPVTWANESPEVSLPALFKALDAYPDYQVIMTYPNADNGGRQIMSMIKDYAVSQPARVLAVTSLGQLRYLSALNHAAVVIGNSSSGIIEAPSFNVPTVDIGARQKGRIAADSVIHCEATSAAISEAISAAIQSKSLEPIINPYDQGGAIPKIITILETMLLNSQKTFFDIDITAGLENEYNEYHR
ncbi:UDP-N-acetylglucosamine 2-epimerase [Legionella hackeliae]|uniref:UDP-N-acetylglucosamine 2-epimerase n=1 Tax=Legionella hackeliae TaxID=449 RepID=A0A0A8UTY5_LEGHA|nr:UDP-N-acetylglucosamine 2-epimerase [Legionella hackeliae]KTD08791.1 N-acylglucosamine 2-epimerase [Legionella hackeliae]CEK10219.1 UDP-N-acetylglucosamine 2-epimerase [Legionella hackeliae]STX46948.1 polysialic acid biosynthesis [Legionella hackeliae]